MMNPYDQLAGDYDRIFDSRRARSEDRAWHRRHSHIVHQAIQRRGLIIDAGCGTGWLLDHYDIPPHRYLGFDLSTGMLEQARRKHPRHHFELGDITTDWPAPLEEAALVASLWASPSYDNPIDQLALAAKYLRTDGQLLYQPHAPAGPAARSPQADPTNIPPICYDEEATGFRPWTALDIRLALAGAQLQGTITRFLPTRHLPLRTPVPIQERLLARPVRAGAAIYQIIHARRTA